MTLKDEDECIVNHVVEHFSLLLAWVIKSHPIKVRATSLHLTNHWMDFKMFVILDGFLDLVVLCFTAIP